MKDPCVGCQKEYFRCRHICPDGIRFQIYKAEERNRAKEAERQENQFTSYRVERIIETKKRAGLE